MMDLPPEDDLSNGWEAVAASSYGVARPSRVGVFVVAEWAARQPLGGTFLDLGCGLGGPRSEPLHARGSVFALDASPTSVRAYQERFPNANVVCEAAEHSALFERPFDAVMAWGLLFLLPAAAQEDVIRRVGAALKPGGSFLFTAPRQVFTWADASTGRPSVSLGIDQYRELLTDAGLLLIGEHADEGENHYYETVRRLAHIIA